MFNKIIIGLGVLNMLMFSAFCMITYQTNMDTKKVNARVTKTQESVEIAQEVIAHSVASLSVDLDKKTHQISIIEESLDPKNMRWAKIKKVREAIKYHKFSNVIHLTKYASAVIDYSEQYDVPISLILAVTKRESAFDPAAISKAHAKGLMQLISPTAKECANDISKRHYNIYKIRDNVQLGTFYLSKMMDRFNGDVGLAVRSYNCGPTCVERVQANEWDDYPSETKKYVEIVLEYKIEYERLGLE